ncbi:hypothetical protein [Pseudonocardia abyssalis]|uniref:hypothetical protein n=1 Tax=Pseudonocardia abyssalis TaxID=2792008 RepID=UPI001CF61DA5|nr:hypothetical protein [Pseudonocardia abyssalis]
MIDGLGRVGHRRPTERPSVIATIVGHLADRWTTAAESGCELVVFELGRGLRFELRVAVASPPGVGGDRQPPPMGEGPFHTAALRLGALDGMAPGFWCEVEMEHG